MNATTIATMKQTSATLDRKSKVESVSRRFMGKYKPKILSVNLQSDSLHQTFLAHTILFYTEQDIVSSNVSHGSAWMVVIFEPFRDVRFSAKALGYQRLKFCKYIVTVPVYKRDMTLSVHSWIHFDFPPTIFWRSVSLEQPFLLSQTSDLHDPALNLA